MCALKASTCLGLLWMQAAMITLALGVVGNKNESTIRCILTHQSYSHSRPWESSGGPKISKYLNRTKDLGCHLSSRNLEEIYESADPVEVDIFDFVTVKVMMNITGNVSCLWHFKQDVEECRPQFESEYSAFVSMDFLKIVHGQAGQYNLSIKSEIQNFTFTFTVHVRSKPSKPYFTGRYRKLNCTSESYPGPIVEWLFCLTPGDSCSKKKGKVYSKNEHFYGVQTVKHEIASKELFDEVIWCCASNELGRECTKLYTTDLNKGSEAPVSDFFLKVGEPLLLRCRAVASTFSFNIIWQFEGKDLSNDFKFDESKMDGDYSSTKLQFAFVASVGKSNSGNYTCWSDCSKHTSKSTKVTSLDVGFINESTSVEQHEIGLKDVFCFEVRLKAFPKVGCIWSSLREVFPCELSDSDDGYSLSSKFCNHSYQSGEYTFYAENEDARLHRMFTLYVKRKPEVKMISVQENAMLFCESKGYPSSTWIWMKCPESISNCTEVITAGIENGIPERTFGFWKSNSTLNLSTLMESVPVSCCANNSAGSSCAHKIFNHPGFTTSAVVSDNTSFYAAIGVCLLCTAILIVLISHKCKKPYRYESQLQMIQFIGSSDNEYIYIDFSDFEYDLKWEFPRENLEFGKVLGSGAFGRVMEATAYGITKQGVSIQVAVKMLKDTSGAPEKDALMSELKMMTHIGNHGNIVNLLGACTKSGPVYLIFEYCCNGDLLNYLRSNRETFHRTLTEIFKQHNFSFYHNFNLTPNTRSGMSMNNGSYMVTNRTDDNIREQIKQDLDLISGIDESMCYSEEEAIKYENRRYEEEFNVLTFEDLLCFSYQVAKGMEFLESKLCIHRDLAARNVLVTHGKVVKICDFGLARDIMNDSNYVVKGNARLPVKWMAPESLFEGIYTVKSDVWSYGILLWEIFSLGVNPYPGMQVDRNFYKLLRNGFKMDQPYYATEEIYIMMQSCWSLASRKRPSFSQLVSILGYQLSAIEAEVFQSVDNRICRASSDYKNILHPSTSDGSVSTYQPGQDVDSQ